MVYYGVLRRLRRLRRFEAFFRKSLNRESPEDYFSKSDSKRLKRLKRLSTT